MLPQSLIEAMISENNPPIHQDTQSPYAPYWNPYSGQYENLKQAALHGREARSAQAFCLISKLFGRPSANCH